MTSSRISRHGAAAAACTALLVASGCSTAPPVGPPKLDTTTLTDDGLAPVVNARVDAAYMKPDADLARYTAVMVDPVSVAYKRTPRPNANQLRGLRGGETNFPLSPEQMHNIKTLFQVTVIEALTADDGYRLATAPGPDVLRVHAQLIDLIVKVPTERGPGREYVFADSLGEVTLIGELFDSESGEILARAVDREVHQSAAGRLEYSTPVHNRAEAKRVFTRWANLLRDRLDALRSAPAGNPGS